MNTLFSRFNSATDNHELMVAICLLNEKKLFSDPSVIMSMEKKGYVLSKEGEEGIYSARIGYPPYPDDHFTEKQMVFLKNYLTRYEAALPEEQRIYSYKNRMGKFELRDKFEERLINDEQFYTKYFNEMLSKILVTKSISKNIEDGATQIITVGDKFPITEMLALENKDVNFFQLSFGKKALDNRLAILRDMIRVPSERREYDGPNIIYNHFEPTKHDFAELLKTLNVERSAISVLNFTCIRGSSYPEETMQALGKVADIFSATFAIDSTILHSYPNLERLNRNKAISIVGDTAIEQQIDIPRFKKGEEVIAEIAMVTNAAKRLASPTELGSAPAIGPSRALQRAHTLAGSRLTAGQTQINF